MLSLAETEYGFYFDESRLLFDYDLESIEKTLLTEFKLTDDLFQKVKSAFDKYGKVDVDNRLKKVSSQLKSKGIAADKVTQIAKKHGKIAANKIKNQKDPRQIALTLRQSFRAGEAEVRKELDITERWVLAVMLMVAVLFIGGFLGALIVVVGLNLGWSVPFVKMLTGVLVAPLTEETAKFISVKNRATGEFFFVFNIIEFSAYVFSMTAAGLALVPVIIMRLIAVGFHGAMTFIHLRAREETEKSGDPKYGKYGLAISMFLHGLWNFLASLGTF